MSKELNYFWAIAGFFRYGPPRTQTGEKFHLSLSLVPHTGKMLQSPQSDLTPNFILNACLGNNAIETFCLSGSVWLLRYLLKYFVIILSLEGYNNCNNIILRIDVKYIGHIWSWRPYRTQLVQSIFYKQYLFFSLAIFNVI